MKMTTIINIWNNLAARYFILTGAGIGAVAVFMSMVHAFVIAAVAPTGMGGN